MPPSRRLAAFDVGPQRPKADGIRLWARAHARYGGMRGRRGQQEQVDGAHAVDVPAADGDVNHSSNPIFDAEDAPELQPSSPAPAAGASCSAEPAAAAAQTPAVVPMQLCVNDMAGKTIRWLEVECSDTVEHVKAKFY